MTSEFAKQLWQRPDVRAKRITAMQAAARTERTRALFSAVMRARWQDPASKAKLMEGIQRAAKLRGPRK